MEAVTTRPEDTAIRADKASEKEQEDRKQKLKAKNKERKRVLNELDYEQKKNLAAMDPAIIADHIAKLVASNHSELSALEVQDRAVPEQSIVSTAEYARPRTLENYADFFVYYALSEKQKKGRDLVLVVCMSAIRVCDIVRQLRAPEIGGALKLIKQNKFDYDKRCLKSPCHVAVSTPGRFEKLRQLRILDYRRVSRVVVDSSMIDVKQRTVWDIDGTLELVAELSKRARIYLY